MNNIKRRVVILIAVAAMAVCSLVVVRGVLLANAKKMGNEIAHSYSVENTRNLIGYETMAAPVHRIYRPAAEKQQ